MARPKRDRVINLGARLDWIRENLVPSGPVEHPTAIQSDSNLRDEIVRYLQATNRHNTFEGKAWTRWRREGGISEAALAVVRMIYSGVKTPTVDLLSCDWADFESETLKAAIARSRWESATSHFGRSRSQVELFGKAVYKTIDETPELPLIGLRAWIPATAVPLHAMERDEQFRWIADFRDIGTRSIHLPDLLPPYHLLKLAALDRSKQPPFNGECYLISQIANGSVRTEIKLRRGCYFDYIDTCEAHAAIMSDCTLQKLSPSSAAVDEALKSVGWNRAHVFDWFSRATFVGVNCLLVTKSFHRFDPGQGKDLFWLHRRGTKSVEAQGVWHVAPAGGHQPLTKGHANEQELSFWYTAVRELLEEIFDQGDLSRHDRELGDHFRGDADRSAIYDAVIGSGAARLFYLGLGLDPATTKPEALCVIVIDWAVAERAFYASRTKHLHGMMKANWEGSLQPYTLDADLMRTMAITPRPGETTLPAGAACLILAANHLESRSIAI